VPKQNVAEGTLIASVSIAWRSIIDQVGVNWRRAYEIPPRVWEEIIAGAYHLAGFDEVVLTPRSNDHGRDIIAVRNGIGSIRILGSVKAYNTGHLVTKEEVHALMGVLAIDPNASKGLFTTTSDFAPRLLDDPRLALAVPHRLELMNGEKLRAWLAELSKKEH
jgi:restriction system protein